MHTATLPAALSAEKRCYQHDGPSCRYAIIEHEDYLRFITLDIPSSKALANLSKDIILAAWTRNSWHVLLDMKTALIGQNPLIIQQLVRAVMHPRYLSLGLRLALTLSPRDAALLREKDQPHGHCFFSTEKLAQEWLSSYQRTP